MNRAQGPKSSGLGHGLNRYISEGKDKKSKLDGLFDSILKD